MYQKITLDNGLRLVTATMPHTRSVAIGFFIGAGSRYETEAQAGISHFIEHLCFKGTSKRPTAMEICTAVEGVGGILNGGTDKELTVYWCKVAIVGVGWSTDYRNSPTSFTLRYAPVVEMNHCILWLIV